MNIQSHNKNFPDTTEQFRAAHRFATGTFDRDKRKGITVVGQFDFVEEHFGKEYGGRDAAMILIIAGIRIAADLIDEEAPESVTLGISILDQLKANFQGTNYPRWRVEDDYFLDVVTVQCKHALFSNAELGKDQVEQVLDIDTSGNTPECAHG